MSQEEEQIERLKLIEKLEHLVRIQGENEQVKKLRELLQQANGWRA